MSELLSRRLAPMALYIEAFLLCVHIVYTTRLRVQCAAAVHDCTVVCMRWYSGSRVRDCCAHTVFLDTRKEKEILCNKTIIFMFEQAY